MKASRASAIGLSVQRCSVGPVWLGQLSATKSAFLKAFNSALETYVGDESRAFAVAHAAAKQADQKEA